MTRTSTTTDQIPDGWRIERMAGGSRTFSHAFVIVAPGCPNERHPHRDCLCSTARTKADAIAYAVEHAEEPADDAPDIETFDPDEDDDGAGDEPCNCGGAWHAVRDHCRTWTCPGCDRTDPDCPLLIE